eukprot:TRINITY_DN109465_c0_g1_i1.p1 TRINITY_DN109465_c0_g1~~TRINITY_DN109465_c0_g1_i1.p1  ORF type:complete len:218 (+),score=24.33 TRINITY_DN109465_c0_g1_i1:63-716(+)
MDEIKESIKEAVLSQPVVTRCYVVGSTLLMLLCSIGIMSPDSLYLNWRLVIYKFQLWRLATCFLFNGTFGMSFFWNSYIVLMQCGQLEREAFARRTADFLWMFLVTASMLLCLTFYFTEYFLNGAMISVFTYVFSRRFPKAQMQLMYVTISAPYMPWVFAVVFLYLGGDFQENLMGIAAAHVYYFFEDIYPFLPSSGGLRVFQTPRALKLFCSQRGL